jgi:signal transduction histidine kinase
MATRPADALLGTNSEMHRINKRVVRVGAAAAWVSAAVFLIIGFIGGNSAMFVEAVGPTMAAGLMTAQIILHRENAGVALFGAAIVTMVIHGVAGNEDSLIPAALALVILPTIGMLFVETRRRWSVATAAFLLLATPFVWGMAFSQALTLGLVMTISFVVTSVVFLTVRSAAATLNMRLQSLFENSPTAVMEEDWSEAVAYLRSEYAGRADRIEPFLMAYPAVVKRAVAKAKVIRVNQAAIELLEADSPEDLLGFRNPNAVEPETMSLYVGVLVALYEGKTSFEQEAPAFTHKKTSIWLQARSVDTSTGAPATNILVGLADITHIKARNDAMAELVKAKDEFIARVSHELRTPLTAVIGLSSELNSLDTLSDEERVELTQLVAGQAAEMSHIVDDLLVAARAEMGTVAIDPIVIDLHKELTTTIDGLGIAVAEVPAFIDDVVADPSRARQILRNLLTNAERYGGPRIRVVSGATSTRRGSKSGMTGRGVPIESASRIFEPYATAHEGGVTGSVGIGLSVARQLAELMGGTLTYYRDQSESVFRLELPLAEKSETSLASKKAAV